MAGWSAKETPGKWNFTNQLSLFPLCGHQHSGIATAQGILHRAILMFIISPSGKGRVLTALSAAIMKEFAPSPAPQKRPPTAGIQLGESQQ